MKKHNHTWKSTVPDRFGHYMTGGKVVHTYACGCGATRRFIWDPPCDGGYGERITKFQNGQERRVQLRPDGSVIK